MMRIHFSVFFVSNKCYLIIIIGNTKVVDYINQKWDGPYNHVKRGESLIFVFNTPS